MRQYDDEYEVSEESNSITSPGKFQGNPPWVPLLWDRVQSGFSDISLHDGSMAIDAFRLDKEIAALTGLEPNPGAYVALWQSDDGFVTHMVMSEDEINACEPDTDDFEYLEFGGD
jgi:hypothetical protein